jgi:CarD family transcriptional regulator
MSKKFLVGDHIVCPLYGAGEIVSKKTVPTRYGNKKFFEVIFKHSNMKLNIRCDNPESVGMRSTAGKKEVRKAFKLLESSCKIEKNVQWKKKHISYLVKLQKGDLISVAEVVQSLMTKKLVRSLSATENKTLNDAKSILISEIAVIENKDIEEISERIDDSFHSKSGA